MKNSILKKISIILIPALLSSFMMNAQIASWSFNNVLTGTGSSNALAGNASLGSSIVTGAFNGGTVYYGEDGWPTGGIDLNAYLEFSITPTAGHTLTISSLAMQIRRSTTGSSGAGPNNWSLRSNQDGYAADVASGTLTVNSTPATTVMLGIAFMNVPSKIVFRLYGYNATISSGGLNRFVYDDIQANGSVVLPLTFDYFDVKAVNGSASISWKLGGEGNLATVRIQRAASGQDFTSIKSFSGDEINNAASFEYVDALNNASGSYAYRIELTTTDGIVSYSEIETVSFDNTNAFLLQPINSGSNQVSFRVNAVKSGNYVFSLFNMNGNQVAMKQTELSAGNQILQMNNAPLKSGIYILTGENGNQKISTKIMVL